ncbi:MAG: hypothetical protein PUP90_22285, partial [Nostoc sp. S4]|nr:hypothetical protein [Nostoc sp. S4]
GVGSTLGAGNFVFSARGFGAGGVITLVSGVGSTLGAGNFVFSARGFGAGGVVALVNFVCSDFGCSGDKFGDFAFCCLGSGWNTFAEDKAVKSEELSLEALCASIRDLTAETGLFGKALPPAIESLIARREVFWGVCVSLGGTSTISIGIS